MHGWMVIVHCCIILHQVNTLSSRLNMDYSCTSKYFLTNQIEKTTSKIIIKMLMILDFKILSLWFVIEVWWYNTLTRENNWFLNVLVKSNFATPTPFGSVSCFVVGICMSNYNLNSFLIHQTPYSKEYQRYLMHRENLGSIWKIGRYPIKVSEVLLLSAVTGVWIKPSPWSHQYFLYLEYVVCFLWLLYISKCISDKSLMEANHMNPGQTAPKGAVWSGSILCAI